MCTDARIGEHLLSRASRVWLLVIFPKWPERLLRLGWTLDCNLKGKSANEYWCLTIWCRFSPLSSRIWISVISLYVAKIFSFSLNLQFCLTCYIFLLQEHKSAKTVGEMKQYVQRIPFMQRAKASLATRKFKRMQLAFLLISFTSRDTLFSTEKKYHITYSEDDSFIVKSQRKRPKTSASDFVLL